LVTAAEITKTMAIDLAANIYDVGIDVARRPRLRPKPVLLNFATSCNDSSLKYPSSARSEFIPIILTHNSAK